MKRLLIVGFLLAAWTSAHAAPYVVLANDQKVVGTQIRAAPDGTIILTTAQGTLRYAKGQYKKAVADKPPEFDAARAKAAAKDYATADQMLRKIISDMANLEWDNAARIVLAKEVQRAKGDCLGAVTTFEDLFKNSPDSKDSPDVGWAYRDALLCAKQYDKLTTALDELIKSGARADAAKAQIMRGDMKLARGEIENAVLDYLRTVVLFESEAASQPEALYKAAQGLKTLRDPRADQLINDLKAKYPSSEFAAKAGG